MDFWYSKPFTYSTQTDVYMNSQNRVKMTLTHQTEFRIVHAYRPAGSKKKKRNVKVYHVCTAYKTFPTRMLNKVRWALKPDILTDVSLHLFCRRNCAFFLFLWMSIFFIISVFLLTKFVETFVGIRKYVDTLKVAWTALKLLY